MDLKEWFFKPGWLGKFVAIRTLNEFAAHRLTAANRAYVPPFDGAADS